MNYYLICPIGIIAGREDLLTYSFDSKLQVGSIVEIPFGEKLKRGIVINSTKKPNFATKPVSKVYEEVIPAHLIELSKWISDYYATRLSIVFQTVLPTGLGKKRRVVETKDVKIIRSDTNHPLTDEQKNALSSIEESGAITHVLHGVTGSGKTRVYQELAKKTLAAKKSVLVLVPEISLTPQLAAEFEQLHSNVLVLHSGLSESKRHTYWQMLRNSEEPWVVVGPRSSLFSPLQNLGLIIVDECHEPSYQQDSQPKYSALRVARKLAELSGNAKLILGSATPLIADFFVAERTNTPIIELKHTVSTRNTTVQIIDMKDRDSFGTHPLFSKKLIEAMNNSIVQNEQILLFHNRRGTARMSLCANCGWTAECPNCHLPMRLHHDFGELRCHVCGRCESLPQVCPDCKSTDIDFKGFGSKRIEAEIKKLYPDSVIARFDSDTPPKEQLHHRYQDLYDNKINIIIGTQGLAKGLDLPNLNTVGIVHADSELFIPDFSSNERSFQLTTQVIGRVGRSGQASKVFIQTLNPEHPIILFAKNQNYKDFYTYELAERKAEHMPPHAHLLQLSTGYASADSARNAAQKLKDSITSLHKDVFVRGPSPSFHEHRGKLYYQQLVVSCAKRSTLVSIAKKLPQRWQYTLDPINLL